MSGDVTYQALKRLTWLPDRDSQDNGNVIAGQEYWDVEFVGGSISNVVLTDVILNGVETSRHVRIFDGVGNTDVKTDDYVIVINKDNPEATTVILPASPEVRRSLIIKDGSGYAGITIDGNGQDIDSVSSFVLDIPFDSAEIIYNGTQWNVVSTTTIGYVQGAGTVTDNSVVRFDGDTGRLTQGSSVIIDDAGNVIANAYSGEWNGDVITPEYGGTGINVYAAGDILYASNSNTLDKLPIGGSGQVLAVSSGGVPEWVTVTGVGTVTNVSGVNENGFNVTVTNQTTSPVIEVSTNVNGILKGDGTAVSAAVAGTDYATGAQGALADTAVQPYDLGTAAFVDTGTGAGDVPLNSDLGSAAYVDLNSVMDISERIGIPFSNRITPVPEQEHMPSLSFTRATTALRVNANGLLQEVGANVMRHTYAAMNREYLGWLIERQKQNIFANSNDLSVTGANGWVTTSAVTLTQGSKDPFGGNTGWVIERNLAANAGYVYKAGVPFTAGTQYVFSKYYDPSNCSDIVDSISFPAAAFGLAALSFNPITRAFATAGTAIQDYGIVEELSNGCIRVYVVATATTTATGNMIVHNVPTQTIGLKMAASCFQLEVGNYPSAYIPTGASAVTRADDQPSYTLPEAVTEGTLYFEGMSLDVAPSSSANGVFLSLGDGTNNNRVFLAKTSGGNTQFSVSVGGSSFNSSTVAIPYNTMFRAVISWGIENGVPFLRGAINGVPVTFANVPASFNPMSIIRFGSYGNGANVNNGMICADSFYHVRPLSAAQCQAITEMPNV